MTQQHQFEDLRPKWRRDVLDRIEEFLAMKPEWTETSLLAAAGMDHRFFTRMRANESWTINKAQHIIDTANKILAGEITLDDVKQSRKKKRS